MVQHHFLLVTYPAQGHLNPVLQLAKRLINMGVLVTLATTVHMRRRMDNTPTLPGLSFATFSDGFDHGFEDDGGHGDFNASMKHYLSQLRRHGSEFLSNLIPSTGHDGGHPFTCVVYTLFLPWAAEVARRLHLPSALLWIQPATVFNIYYYYFKDDRYIKSKLEENSTVSIELPGLQPLEWRELPSFITSHSGVYAFAVTSSAEDFQVLRREPNPTVLVNTFEELEAEALRGVDHGMRMIPIGPLVRSGISNGTDPSDACFGMDLVQDGDDYMEWLNSKPKSSVIYVSFGSLCVLQKKQMQEIARGLVESGHPFLWVIREEKERDKVSEYIEKMEKKGKIVKWCKQVEVLSHKSVGCFMSHCGWNSTLESLVAGMPMVSFPQWADQNTNAKLIEQVWKTGVRVKVKEDDGGGIAGGEEIMRCLEEVMRNGEKGKEVRTNASSWKEVAEEAIKKAAASDTNLRTFLHQLAAAPT